MSDRTSTGFFERYRQIAVEVADFASAEAKASGLPGAFGGPADAYRHLIWVAEMSRRIGPAPAYAIAEANELSDWRADLEARLQGGTRFPSNTPAARRMDRGNNRFAAGGGAVARDPATVVEWARQTVERGRNWGGTGHNASALWFEQRSWDPPAAGTSWPKIDWPAIGEAEHYRAYPAWRPEGHRSGEAVEGLSRCPTSVAPHMRAGHPVRGHVRACPTG